VNLGLLISVLLHVAILGGALLSIRSRPELRLPETEPVAVGMISPGEVTKVRQGVRTATLLEAEPKESSKGRQARKEATRPKTAPSAPSPSPPPSAAPEEKAAPPVPKALDPPPSAAEAQKAAEALVKLEAERQKLAEEQRLAAEKKQAEAQEKAEAIKRAEAQKLADEKKRAEEAQRLAEETKRAEEEQRRQAEERQKRLEQQRKQAELKKKREEDRKRREAALKKKREAARKREEEKRRQEADAAQTKRFDADKIAALLNKVPDKGAPPPSAAADQPTKAKGPTLGATDGRDQIISASERAMITQVIESCVIPNWTVLSGGASAQETVVKIRLRFNKDGTLRAPPEITNPQGTPYFRAISESALRAVQHCEPYNLPRSLYEHWKDIIMNFSPRDMF
jgi:colicin import membrane protein